MGSVMNKKKTALIISAHSADFVWRCGGAIALHQKLGYEVTIACLSYGERGESAKLWKQENMTLERVKKERRKEAEAAAQALNAHDIRFFDFGDYPLEVDTDGKYQIVDLIREIQPYFMMSHSKWDPYNTDHMYATEIAIQCRRSLRPGVITRERKFWELLSYTCSNLIKANRWNGNQTCSWTFPKFGRKKRLRSSVCKDRNISGNFMRIWQKIVPIISAATQAGRLVARTAFTQKVFNHSTLDALSLSESDLNPA